MIYEAYDSHFETETIILEHEEENGDGGSPTKMIRCRCGNTTFNVGSGNYLTVAQCTECNFVHTVHTG